MLFKLLQLTENGGKANEAIVNGRVKVNDAIEIQKLKKIRAGYKAAIGNTIVQVNT